MSELKAIRSGEIYNIIEYEDCNRTDDLYYPKSEVDATIAELKAEARKLKRALWLARAERAASWQIHFSLCHNHSIEREFSINGASKPCEGMATMRTAKDWAMIWKKVECKCRIKAEEYK